MPLFEIRLRGIPGASNYCRMGSENNLVTFKFSKCIVSGQAENYIIGL